MDRFDPKFISEEERVRTGLQPATSNPQAPEQSAPVKPPPPMRPKKKNDEKNSDAKIPAPPPRSEYPQPPEDAPPLTKQQRQVREGMNFHLFRPSVWEVAQEFYAWADPKVQPPPFFPLPKGWFFEHGNTNRSDQMRIQIPTAAGFVF